MLWDHANIDPPTHRWIAREFGWVPTSFFQQMSRCATAGHLVAATGFDELPDDVVPAPPRNRPRWTLHRRAPPTAASWPAASERTFAWLDALEPGATRCVVLPGYTHLDVFFGRDAARDVFGHVVARPAAELPCHPGELESAERDCFGSLSTPCTVGPRSHHGPRPAAAAAHRRPARRAVPDGLRRRVRGHPRPLPPAPVRLHAPDARRLALATPRTSLQDVFLRAYGALRHDDRPVTLRAWLYRVAHNRCIDHLRRPDAAAGRDLRGLAHAAARPAGRGRAPRGPAPPRRGRPAPARAAALRAAHARARGPLLRRAGRRARTTSVPAVKSLLVRARIGLVEAGEARDAGCVDIRADLALRARPRRARQRALAPAPARLRRLPRLPPGPARRRSEGLARARARRRRPARRRWPSCSASAAPARAPRPARGAGGRRRPPSAAAPRAARPPRRRSSPIVCCAAVVGGGAAEVRQQVQPPAPRRPRPRHAARRNARRAAAVAPRHGARRAGDRPRSATPRPRPPATHEARARRAAAAPAARAGAAPPPARAAGARRPTTPEEAQTGGAMAPDEDASPTRSEHRRRRRPVA